MFRFKQFNVDQTGCAMKINTDGVLLGALSLADNPIAILDIGTGTGVIALMLAQRFSDAKIDAVEIDEGAAQTAAANFLSSPFFDRLKLFPNSFEDYFKARLGIRFDMIVSNPPFYINSLKSTGIAKKLAKHTDVLFFERLIATVPAYLKDKALFWLILPITTAGVVKKLTANVNLCLQQVISVRSYPISEPHREILAFSLHQTKTSYSEFVIYEELNHYSEQYQTALKDFFTIFH